MSISPTAVQESFSFNPLITFDPKADQVTNTRWARVWTVATAISAIALLFFGCSPLFFLEFDMMFTPIYLILLVSSAAKLTEIPWNKASNYREEVRIDQKIIEKMNSYDNKTFESKLKAFKIPMNEKLKSIMGRFEHLMDLKKRYLDKSSKHDFSANSTQKISLRVGKTKEKIAPSELTVEKTNFNDEKQAALWRALQKKRAFQQGFKNEAALYHLKGAYLLHLMKTPGDCNSIDSFGSFKPIALAFRSIAKEAHDLSSNVLFVKNKPGFFSKSNYTADDLLKKDLISLSKELFG